MAWLLSVSIAVLVLLPTANSYVYDRSGTSNIRDHQDSYGTYYLDRGYKVYTRCYQRDSLTRDQCRRKDYRRGTDYYRDRDYRYDRPQPSLTTSNTDKASRDQTYDRDGDYYNNLRGKVNVGRGSFRVINGRDAELICEFPRGQHLISNIVWEKVDNRDSYSYSRTRSLRDYLGRRMEVETVGDYGSVLIIRDWEERDTGIYRCLATRSYSSGYRYSSSYGRKETIYMETNFDPRSGRNEYSGYFSRDSGYSPSSYWRTSGVKASEDTIVTDTKLEKSGKGTDKNL